MAVSPLFVEDVPLLKARLRLGNLPIDGSGEPLFIEAVEQARAAFYRRTSEALIVALQSYDSVDNPSTKTEYLRKIAELTETMLVRRFLLDTMPVSIIGRAETLQVWNEEGFSRDADAMSIDRIKRDLDERIEQNMQLLTGSEALGEEVEQDSFVISPAVTPQRPGASLWPYIRT